MNRFKEQVVLITGANSGIGRAAASLFLAEGAFVVGADRDEISLQSDRFRAIRFDVSDSGEVAPAIEEIIRTYGRIDILVNSAGIHMNAAVTDTTEEQWDRMFSVNVKGVYLLCHETLPHMLRAGHGVIINVASRCGMTGSPNSAAYCASKAAVVNLTREMAVDYTAKGIRVLAVAPGMVETPMLDRQFPDGPERKRRVMQQYPLKRFSRPEEVADVILFLASAQASGMSGAIVPIDGGRSAY